MQLRVNQRIELVIQDRVYTVRVESAESRIVWVSAPFERGQVYFLPVGTPVRGRVPASDGLWDFTGRISEQVRGDVPMLRIQLSGPMVRVDRRSTDRRPTALKARVTRLDQPSQRPADASLLDLSEGGGRLAWTNPWPEPRVGERLLISIPGTPPATLVGQVVWRQAHFERGRCYWVGLRWVPESMVQARKLLESGRIR
jgi:c-di-GMP-binding flagellar brake protein YcgR